VDAVTLGEAVALLAAKSGKAKAGKATSGASKAAKTAGRPTQRKRAA
jgi:topoisomerase IA-like protein